MGDTGDFNSDSSFRPSRCSSPNQPGPFFYPILPSFLSFLSRCGSVNWMAKEKRDLEGLAEEVLASPLSVGWGG